MNSSFFAQNKPPASEDSIKAAASASVLNGITRKESSNFKVGQTVDMDEMNTQCNLGADNQSFFYCRLVGDRWESASRYLCPFLFCSPWCLRRGCDSKPCRRQLSRARPQTPQSRGSTALACSMPTGWRPWWKCYLTRSQAFWKQPKRETKERKPYCMSWPCTCGKRWRWSSLGRSLLRPWYCLALNPLLPIVPISYLFKHICSSPHTPSTLMLQQASATLSKSAHFSSALPCATSIRLGGADGRTGTGLDVLLRIQASCSCACCQEGCRHCSDQSTVRPCCHFAHRTRSAVTKVASLLRASPSSWRDIDHREESHRSGHRTRGRVVLCHGHWHGKDEDPGNEGIPAGQQLLTFPDQRLETAIGQPSANAPSSDEPPTSITASMQSPQATAATCQPPAAALSQQSDSNVRSVAVVKSESILQERFSASSLAAIDPPAALWRRRCVMHTQSHLIFMTFLD